MAAGTRAAVSEPAAAVRAAPARLATRWHGPDSSAGARRSMAVAHGWCGQRGRDISGRARANTLRFGPQRLHMGHTGAHGHTSTAWRRRLCLRLMCVSTVARPYAAIVLRTL
jgi:hypothetical protein